MFLTKVLERMQRSWYPSIPYDRHAPFYSNRFFKFPAKDYDNRWQRRRNFLMVAHAYGRRRNCSRLAIRSTKKDLARDFKQAKGRAQDMRDLDFARVEAAAAELGYDAWYIREALVRSHIHLNTNILAELAVWEPRSFRALVGIAAHTSSKPEEQGGLGMGPSGPGTKVIL